MSSEETIAARKDELRAEYKARLATFIEDPKLWQPKVDAIIEKLRLVLPKNVMVGGFRALKDELPLDRYFLERIATCAFPRVEGPDLQFYLPQTAEGFSAGSFQIHEPLPNLSQKFEPHELSALVVPGVAFDHQGYRMGRGQGFYDRYLKSFNGLKVGVALSSQISESDLPREEHDIAMDVVVTENFVLRRYDT